MGLPSSAGRDERLQAAGLERIAYSITETADMLGVSPYHVGCLVRAGRIPHKRVGAKIVIPAAALREWLENTDVWSSSVESARSAS